MKTTNLYNGCSIEFICQNLPATMQECHKIEYINTCKRVIELQVSGYNLDQIESLKNYNHRLFTMSLNN